jgi:hypothetical protein
MVETKEEKFWEKFAGKYDQDSFYILDEGGFYDPLGVHFDAQGFDELGGFYNDDGYYVAAEPKCPIRLDREGLPL